MASGGYGAERRGGVRTASASSCSAVQRKLDRRQITVPGDSPPVAWQGLLGLREDRAESAAPAFSGRRASRSLLRRQASPPSVKASLRSDHEVVTSCAWRKKNTVASGCLPPGRGKSGPRTEGKGPPNGGPAGVTSARRD